MTWDWTVLKNKMFGRLTVTLLLLLSPLSHHPLVMHHGILLRRSIQGTKHGSIRYMIFMDSALPCFDIFFHNAIGLTITNLLQVSGFFNNAPSCQNSYMKQTRIYLNLSKNLKTSITNERNIIFMLSTIASTFSYTSLQNSPCRPLACYVHWWTIETAISNLENEIQIPMLPSPDMLFSGHN